MAALPGTASTTTANDSDSVIPSSAPGVAPQANAAPTPGTAPPKVTISPSGLTMFQLSTRALDASAITDIRVVPMVDRSPFVKPQSVKFNQNGRERRWDMVQSHPSVGILLYHKQLDAVILVRQFRPAVYVSEERRGQVEQEGGLSSPPRDGAVIRGGCLPLACGFTYELCAGLVDKAGKALAEIAKEEVLEETGYDVPVESLQEVTSWISSMGISGTRHTVFYAEVDESMHAGWGGGNAGEGEAIDVLALHVDQIDLFVMDQSIPKSSGVVWAVTWLKARLASLRK